MTNSEIYFGKPILPDCYGQIPLKEAQTSNENIREYYSIYVKQRNPLTIVSNIAIIDVRGNLFTDSPLFRLALTGSTNYQEIEEDLSNAIKKQKVESIVLLMDSPGGQVAGSFELADVIAETNKAKPVFAYVSGLCCSACYLLASQCEGIFASKTSMIGSIGTVYRYYNYSKMLEQAGIEEVVITNTEATSKAASYKDDKQHREELQEIAQELGDQFWQYVTHNRKPNEDTRTGKVYTANQAGKMNLIDGIGTLDELITEIIEKKY